jgi:hypothetical protein
MRRREFSQRALSVFFTGSRNARSVDSTLQSLEFLGCIRVEERRSLGIHGVQVRTLEIARADLFEEPHERELARGQSPPCHGAHWLTTIERAEGVGLGSGSRDHRIRLGPDQERQEDGW